ncbi:glycosyl transferase [Arthrobacter sp. StoSoilB19]|nr:glycosyl transferase [Arthrobacter sp. StoSoilB19]
MKLTNDSRTFLSIIIVTYNAGKFLPRTLSSLEEQVRNSQERVEVIAVDGNSSDDTVQLLRSSPAITRVVSEPDNGIYDAMNKGALLATGEWLHFLNAGDSFASPTALDRILQGLLVADSNGTPWLVAGARNLGGRENGSARRIPSLPHKWWRHAYGIQPHCHQATWFRRSTLIDSGLHSLDFGTAGDFDVVLRFGLLSRPEVIDTVLIDYLGGGISQVPPRLTASLQSQVRSDRFNLSSRLGAIDNVFGQGIALINAARITAGRMKGKYLTSTPEGDSLAPGPSVH